jgi:hypothetical protein
VLSKIDEKWDPEGDDPRSPSAIAADLIARHGRELWKRVWDSRPVIGHIAEIARTGGTISAQELADLAALARYPRRRRLLGGEAGLRRADVPDVAVERRLALRRRLGDFGLFRALELIDGGCDTPGDVLDGLLASSGLPDVVAMVDEVFRDRSDLLRAESVLCGLERDALARESGIDRAAAARMLARIERVRLAPEADALRRLYVIRLACDDADGRLRLGDERRLELRRLLPDGAAAERLGAAPGTPAHELAALARRRWTWWRAKQNQTPISPTLLRVAEEACRAYQQLARGLAIA